MYKDLQLPAIMNCGSMKNSLVEMNLWINSGGAKSIIHKVGVLNILVLEKCIDTIETAHVCRGF